MKQRTLAMMTGFEQYTRKTRRAIFLEEMEQVVPWRKLCGLVEPHYPKPGNGRPPVGVERMLRIYFLQQWFNLSDPALEEALYDSAVLASSSQRSAVRIPTAADPLSVFRSSRRFCSGRSAPGFCPLQHHLQAFTPFFRVRGYFLRALKIVRGLGLFADFLQAPINLRESKPHLSA